MAQNQAYLFLVFSIVGVIIGVLFDFFRILRKTIKTSNIITSIEDILFWILTGFLIIYSIWYFNNGEIRLFMFLAIILGILIYMSTLSNIIVNTISKILGFILKILEVPIKVIKTIFMKIMGIFNQIFTYFIKFIKNFTNKKGNLEKNGE